MQQNYKKQRKSRTTKIITATPTVYVCVHVWHYYMYVFLHAFIWMRVCVYACVQTPQCYSNILYFFIYFIMFYFDFIFDFYLWPSFYLRYSNSTPTCLQFHIPTLSFTQHIPPTLSLLATLYGFLHNIYLSTMLWCLTYNLNLSNRIESTYCELKINTFTKSISVLVIDLLSFSRSPNSTISRINAMHFQPFLNLRPETGYLRAIPK